MKTAMMKNPRVFISKDIRETIAIMKQEQETMKMEQRIKMSSRNQKYDS